MTTIDMPERSAQPTVRSTTVQAIRSELIKLVTLRSMVLTAAATIVFGVAVSALRSFASGRAYPSMSPDDRAAFDPTSTGMVGYLIAQLIIGVLGVLMITSEYATGLISTSATAVPRRVRLLGAKLAVLTGCALIITEIESFAAFATSQAILGSQDASTANLADLGVLRAVIGCGLYLTVVGVLGLALGAMLRATAGALAVIVGVTFMVPALIPLFPQDWATYLGKYWPTMAARSVMSVQPDPNLLGPWTGLGVMCAFTAAVLVAAVLLFRHRDLAA